MQNIQNSVDFLIKKYSVLPLILNELKEHNAHAFLVGGAARDILLHNKIIQNNTIKDIDIEVHAISLDNLEKLLSQFGPVRLVGKVFGVLKMDHIPVDWSIPRVDASGRKPEVVLDPHMGITKALERRDLTMNALAIDLSTYEVIDPFKGCQDMEKNILRSPNPQFFAEDPLRLYRIMQFISRFSMTPDKELDDLARTVDIKAVSQERIEEEFNKLLLKSAYPSQGIRWLYSINRVREIMPELADTIGIPQEYEWHPEGDVFEHSMQALDAAAQFDYHNAQEKIIVLYAALTHDLGKASTTQLKKGRLRSFGHDSAGQPLAYALVYRLTHNKKLSDTVAALVRWHMQPPLYSRQGAKPGAYKRLAKKLADSGATMRMLTLLSQADGQGRNPKKGKPLSSSNEQIEEFARHAQKLGIWKEPLKHLLTGQDLLAYTKPGPHFGTMLKYAYEKQLANNIIDKQELLELVLKKFKIS